MENSLNFWTIDEKKKLINQYLKVLPKTKLETIFKISNLNKNNYQDKNVEFIIKNILEKN